MTAQPPAAPTPPTPDHVRDAIIAIVGAGHVLTDASDMAPFITDWRERYHGAARMVVRPGSAAEVSQVVRLCFEHAIPIVPQGGNTSLCGGATPDASGQAIVLRLDRMNRIREISAIDAMMLVEAGCVLQTMQEAAAEKGFLFPLSLGAEGSCQIGGNISTNAGGTAVLRYGTTRELVLGLEVVLADGTLCDWLTPLRKNNAGYDLKQLFIGAEGSLGIITAAAVKLFAMPAQTATAMVTLADPDAALTLLLRLRATLGERLSSFEIINSAQAEIAITHVPGNSLPFTNASPWYVLIEVTDALASHDLRQALEGVLGTALEDGVITDAVLASSTAQAASLWRLRHSVSDANKRAGFGVSHDTAVPLSAQAAFVRGIEARIGAAFPRARLLMVGHMGDGNIHVVVMLDRADYPPPKLAEATSRINALVDAVTLELHGTISAEHGIGQTNKQRLLDGRGGRDVALMRALKATLDPKSLLNPGKLFDL